MGIAHLKLYSMARTFTLHFIFEQKEYEADITVYEDMEPYAISANITNPHLHQKVPESKRVIEFGIDEQTNMPITSSLQKLKQAIFQAFKEHESQSPPVGLW